MTAAAILALIQAGEMSLPSIIAAFDKFHSNSGSGKTFEELVADARANDDATIAAAKAELGM